MSRGLHIWLVYLLAFALAAGLGWVVQAVMATALFAPGITMPYMLTVWALPVLAGLSVFALIFGLLMQVKMGARFWLWALALCSVVYVLAGAGIFAGYVTPIEAAVMVLIVIFVLGRVMAGRLVGAAV